MPDPSDADSDGSDGRWENDETSWLCGLGPNQSTAPEVVLHPTRSTAHSSTLLMQSRCDCTRGTTHNRAPAVSAINENAPPLETSLAYCGRTPTAMPLPTPPRPCQ